MKNLDDDFIASQPFDIDEEKYNTNPNTPILLAVGILFSQVLVLFLSYLFLVTLGYFKLLIDLWELFFFNMVFSWIYVFAVLLMAVLYYKKIRLSVYLGVLLNSYFIYSSFKYISNIYEIHNNQSFIIIVMIILNSTVNTIGLLNLKKMNG